METRLNEIVQHNSHKIKLVYIKNCRCENCYFYIPASHTCNARCSSTFFCGNFVHVHRIFIRI